MRLQKAAGGLRPGLIETRHARLADRLAALSRRLDAALARPAGEKRRSFDRLAARLDPTLVTQTAARKARETEALLHRLTLAGQTRNARARARLEALDRTRQTLGYRETLKRGFAVVRGEGKVVTTKKAAARAKALEIEFADGKLSLDTPSRPNKPKPKTPPPEQGSFF